MRYPRDVRYPGRLQMLLGDDYTVIEEGCNGRTTIHDDPIDGWKNGLDYLRPCLNSHKPVDIVILMLGSNDLKTTFHLTAEGIADGVAVLVDVIQTFTEEKQGFVPKIILVSPPEIGEGMKEDKAVLPSGESHQNAVPRRNHRPARQSLPHAPPQRMAQGLTPEGRFFVHPFSLNSLVKFFPP